MATLIMALIALGAMSSYMSAKENAKDSYNDTRQNYINQIKQEHPELSASEAEAYVDQYMQHEGEMDWGSWKTWVGLLGGPLGLFANINDSSNDYYIDKSGLESALADFEAANATGELGYAPEAPDLAKIQEEAYKEIDDEYAQLRSLYDESFANTQDMLQKELNENALMFGDYRNQVLTNNAMQQQMLAGSTRYELDRQQRNSIIRGASAAQRLVANINTQLGLQARSAQQSLDTSNALAQNLLAHRQAQQGIRNTYLQAQNNYNTNMANLLHGQARDRYSYGQDRKQGAIDEYDYNYNQWRDDVAAHFRGNSQAETSYVNRYGRGNKSKPGI